MPKHSLRDGVLLTPTPPHGSRTNMGVIEPVDQTPNNVMKGLRRSRGVILTRGGVRVGEG